MTAMRVFVAILVFLCLRLLRWFVPHEELMAGQMAFLLTAAIGCPIGLVVGYLLSRDGDVDTRAYRITAWGNLLSWLIPTVGVALSVISWQFARRSEMNARLYSCLGYAGFLMAVASAGIGGGLAYHERAFAQAPSYVTSDRYQFEDGAADARRSLAEGNPTALYAYFASFKPLVLAAPGLLDCDPSISDRSKAGTLFMPLREASIDDSQPYSSEERARAQSARRYANDYNRVIFEARKKEILRLWCPKAQLAPEM